MDNKQATMSLPMDLIAPAIQAHVNTAIVEALRGHEGLVTATVARIMNEKVDEKGNPTTYGGQPWMSWAVQNLVRDAVKLALTEHLAKDKARIEKAIASEFKKSNSPIVQALIGALTRGMTDMVSSSYRLTVEIKP